MVAVVNGSGLGLQGSPPPTRSNVGSTNQGQDPEQIYVNSATGNLVIQDRDEALSTLGTDVSLLRTYNSQGLLDDPSANNWRLSVQERLLGSTGTVNTAGSTITKEFGDGAELVYTYNSTLGLYVSALGEGAHDTLAFNSSNSQWTWTDGTARNTETYDSSGRLSSSSDVDGNVTTYAYTGSLLTSISDGQGQVVYLDYSGNNLTDVRTYSNGQYQTLTRYAYDGQNRLTSATVDLSPGDNSISDGKTYVTTYTYDGTSTRVASITQSDGTTVSFGYVQQDGAYRLHTYTDGDGKVTTLSYSSPSATGQSGSLTANANAAVLSTTTTTSQTYNLNAAALTAGGTATPAYVQGNSNDPQSPTNTVSVTFTSAQTAGHLNVIAIGWNNATSTISSVTDTAGNTYTLAIGPTTASGNGRQSIYYAKNINAAAANSNTVTVTFSGSVPYPDLRATEYSGINTTSPLDVTKGASGSSTSTSSGSVTTTNANDLIIAANYVANSTSAAGSGYTQRMITADSSIFEDRKVTSTGSYSASATQSPTGWWIMQLAAFKAGTNPSYYSVPAGATWQSIANTLYGINSAAAGTALQTAMGNPTLSTGLHLTGMPATLTVSTTTTVPAYYPVPAGATWTSITQAVYGTSNANAVAALQTATGNPTLTTGLQLTVPSTLTYTAPSTLYLRTDVTDPNTQVTSYIEDSLGRLTSFLSPAVGGTTQLRTDYTYDSDNNLLTSTQDPTGLNRVTTYNYDANGNLLLTRDADGNTVTRTYDSANQLLTETHYLVPDPDGAGSGQPSAPMTTRYAYDTHEQLRFAVSADGRVTEYRYNGSGELTSKVKYDGTIDDVSSLSPTTSLSLSTLTTWATGADQTKLERTDYTYDFRGNVGTATAYTATDGTGAGVAGTATVTQYVYDQRGQLLQTVTPRGSGTTADATNSNIPYAATFTYDGLGRLTNTTQWIASGSTSSTLTNYDATNHRVVTTQANSLVTTSVYDAAGHLISVSNSGPGISGSLTTTYAYDADGRLRMATDPDQVRTYIIYDEAGRKVGDIDGTGALTQYIYNNASQVVKTVAYADRLSAATLATLVDAQGKPVNVSIATLVASVPTSVGRAYDQITRDVYDAAGLKVYSLDAGGDVTQYLYDGAGRLTDQVQYANPFSIAANVNQVLPSAIAVTPDPVNDRRTRYFYDNDGNLRGQLDATGYLTEYTYDAGGHLTRKMAYANPSPSAYLTTGTLANLIPTLDDETTVTPAEDATTYYFYDGEGRKIGEFQRALVDGTGYLTETQYDVDGNVSATVRYANAVAYTSVFATLKSNAAASGIPQTTSYQYDGSGRVTYEIDYENTKTQYLYDAVGNLVSQTVAYGGNGAPNDTRTTQTRYDALGRVTQELSGEGSNQITVGMTDPQINAVWTTYGTTYTYDADGRKISETTHPYDQISQQSQTNTTYYYYDEDGNLRFTVDATGAVTESVFNALGQVTDQIIYAIPLTTQLSGLTGGLLTSTIKTTLTSTANPALDSHTTDTYFLTGQVSSTTTAEGGLVGDVYDAFGDETTRTTKIDSARTLTQTFKYDRDGHQTYEQSDASGINQNMTYAYDSFGRVASATDQYGNQTRTNYDRLGRVIATFDAQGNQTSTDYDAFSRVLHVKDAYQNTTTYAYTDATQTMTVTTPEGVTVTTVHNRNGQTLRVTTSGSGTSPGNSTLYSYDLNGNLISTSDSLSAVALESRAYDTNGRELTSTDADGVVTRFTYDADNRVLTKTVDNAGLALKTQYEYNNLNQITKVTEPGNKVTSTKYDRDGRVTLVTVDPGQLNIQTSYAYDNNGDVTTVTDGYGTVNQRVTKYYYDVMGRRTQQVVDPGSGTNPATGLKYLNLATNYKYDANGNLIHRIVINNDLAATPISTWYVYDSNNRLTFTIDALGGVTQTRYDSDGRVASTTRYANTVSLPTGDQATVAQATPVAAPGLDRTTQSFYDNDGRQVYTIDALGGVTQYSYDINGKVTRTRGIAGVTLTGTYGNAAAVTTALGSAAGTLGSSDRVAYTAYDVRGQAVYTVDAVGAVSYKQYDLAGHVISVTNYASLYSGAMDVADLSSWATGAAVAGNSHNQTTRYWYDGAGRRVYSLDAAGGYLTETRYDDVNNVVTTIVYYSPPTIPAGATASDIKNHTGGVVFTTDPTKDQSTAAQYDAAGRLTKLTDATTTAYETYGYDALGNKTSFTNKAQQTWTYVYDLAGNMIEEDSPSTPITSMSGLGGALSATTVSAKIVSRMTYDAMGDVLTLQEGIEHFSNNTEDASKSRTTTYSYDALGRQTSVTLPAVYVYTYTTGDETVASGSVTRSDTKPPITTHVVYDALGNEVANQDPGGFWSYKVYDALGRVVYDVDADSYVTGYGYDSFGNQTSLTRYALALATTLAAAGGGSVSELTASAVGGAITVKGSTTGTVNVQVSSGADRQITKAYDADNRLKQVTQPQTFNFEPNSGIPNGATFTLGETTFYKYDAFGKVIRTARLISPNGNPVTDPDIDSSKNSWAYTYDYYDTRGLLAAEVDEDGYLTVYQHGDANGDLTDKIEYALKPSGTVDINGYGAINSSNQTNFPNGSANGYDRETRYTYDQLNRLVQQKFVGVQYTQVSGSAGSLTSTPQFADQLTQYTYDALGNQTSVTQNGGTTFTYYDVLGRTIAVAGPARDRGDGTSITPLTLMKRDVFGNLVQQTVYAAGAAGTVTTGSLPTYAALTPNLDRTTQMWVDVNGDVLQTEQLFDTNGADQIVGTTIEHYASYDSRGNLAKEWQIATNSADPNISATTDAIETIYTYDARGNQTAVIQPQQLGTTNVVSHQRSHYNAFGEIDTKSLDNGTPAVHYYYDQGGRLWLTNQTDGVYRVYLYNLAGEATAKLEAPEGSGIDLSTTGSPGAAYAMGGLMRTETRYDAMGNVVEQRLPTYTSPSNQVAIDNTTVTVFTATDGTPYLQWQAPPDSTLQAALYLDGGTTPVYASLGSGSEYGYTAQYSLASVPTGTHSYRIQYQRPGDTTVYGIATGTFTLNSTTNAALTSSDSTTGSITNVTASVSGSNALISWKSDPFLSTTTFEIYVGGAWVSYTGSGSESAGYSVTVPLQSTGTYQYRITDWVGGYIESQVNGTLSFTSASSTSTTSLSTNAPATGTISNVTAGVSGSTVTVNWQGDSANITSETFELFVGGSWVSYTGAGTEGGYFNASFPLPSAGTYQYRITDYANGAIEAQGTGSISFTASNTTSTTTLTLSIPGTGTVSNVGASVSGTTVTASWTPDSASTSSATFEVYVGGAWQSYAGSGTENGVHTASFSLPTDGTYQYRITDYVNGAIEALAVGSLTYTAPYSTSSTSTSGSSSPDAVWNAPGPVSVSGYYGGQGSGYVSGSSTPVQTPITGEGGVITGYTTSWSGTDSVSLSWMPLPSGSYTVTVYYNTHADASRGIGSVGTYVQFAMPAASSGTFSWSDSASGSGSTWPSGGVDSINFFQITNNSTGALMLDSRGTAVETTIAWAAPADTSYYGTLQYRVAGTSTYTTIAGTRSGGQFVVTVPVTAAGTYDFITSTYQLSGETQTNLTLALGQFVSTGSSVYLSYQQGTPQYLSGVTASGSYLYWNATPGGSDSIVVTLNNPSTGAVMYTLSPVAYGGGNYYASFYNVPTGTYKYSIQYVRSGWNYLLGSGTAYINTTTTVTNYPATVSIGTPSNVSAVGGMADLGNGVFGWTTPANSGDSVVFKYKAAGAGSWAGTLPISGAYQVNLLAAGLSGSIDFEIDYTASGGSQPYRVAGGRIIITTTVNTTPATAAPGAPTNLSGISSITDLGNGIFGWSPSGNAGDTVVFRYKAAGASSWAGTLPITGSYQVNLLAAGLSGSIDYEIDYTASGQSRPYRVGTGRITITTTINNTPATVTLNSANSVGTVSGFTDLGSGVFGWTTPANAGDSVVFRWKPQGASGWSGTVPVTGAYQVNLLAAGLSGTIDYEIDYTASGGAQPYRMASGGITITQTSVGSGTVTDTTASALSAQPAAPSQTQMVDRWGNVISMTDVAGKTTTYRFNQFSQLIERHDPQVSITAVTMTSATTASESVDQYGMPVSYNYYDLYGRMVGTRDADGNLNGQTFNAAGEVVSEQHADGSTKSYVYDAFGDDIQDTVGNYSLSNTGDTTVFRTRYAYDQAGRLTDVAQESTQNALNGFALTGARKDLPVFTASGIVRKTYLMDQAGRRIAETTGDWVGTNQSAPETIYYWYDLHGNMLRMVNPMGAQTQYGYDEQDRKTSMLDGNGRTESWTYDYFGHLTAHMDLGGTSYAYTYDTTSSYLLTHESSTGGEFAGVNKTYKYDTADHLIEIDDVGASRTTLYGYDTKNRIVHMTTEDGSLAPQDDRYDYDALGRISHISGVGYSVTYSYDAAGNRTNINANYSAAAGQTHNQNLWYSYDKMNRVLISEGVISGTTVSIDTDNSDSFTQGTILGYDGRGDRLTAQSYGQYLSESGATFSTLNGPSTLSYTYDGLGRLLTTSMPVHYSNGTNSTAQVESRSYDGASRIINDTTNFDDTNGALATRIQTNVYNDDGTIASQTTTKNGIAESSVTYAGGYDESGNLTYYSFTVNNATGGVAYTGYDQFTYSHGDSYLQATHVVSDTSGHTPGSTVTSYNVDQQIQQYTDQKDSTLNRYFLDNDAGQEQLVVQGPYGSSPTNAFTKALIDGSSFFNSANAAYFFFTPDGKATGTFGQLGTSLTANFDVNYQPISSDYPAPVPPTYVVQQGDTLTLVAMRVYGDAKLWYVIAQANGLTDPSGILQEGTTLTIPNNVVSLSNNSSSYKPFDARLALGNQTPAQPMPPPPKHSDCGIIGTLLMVIVAVIVTIYTAGLAAGAMGATVSATGTAASTAGAWAAGTAAVSGGLTSAAAGIAAAAVGGAVGSIASQAVGIATGNQTGFDWTGVAMGAIGAGVASGLGSVVQSSATLRTFAQSSPSAFAAADGAVSDTLTQGIAVATGLQSSFNWRDVAISAVAAPAAAAAAGAASGALAGFAPSISAFGGRVAGGLAGSAVRAVFDGKMDTATVIADAFGNAVGNAIVDAQAQAGTQAAFNQALDASGGEAFRPLLRTAGMTQAQQDDWIATYGDQFASIRQATQQASSEYGGIPFEQLPADVQRQALQPFGDQQVYKSLANSPLTANFYGDDVQQSSGAVTSDRVLEDVDVTARHYQPTLVDEAAGVLDTSAKGVQSAVDTVGKNNVVGIVTGIQFAIGGIPRTLLNIAIGVVASPALKVAKDGVSDLLQNTAFEDAGDPYAVKRVSDSLASIGVDFVFGKAMGVVDSAADYKAAQKVVSGELTQTEETQRQSWLARLKAGNDFNREQAGRYQMNEVYVEGAPGSGVRYRVDSYNPGEEIVSRKFTQLGDVKEDTAMGYIDEFAKKYPEGAEISKVPTSVNPTNGINLGGQKLQGDLILEVPVQKSVPQSVIDYAASKNIVIRDINGKEYK
ncbi:MAG TPA: LysM peptidoglycan-binding domain-containing protein [Steroidobacteraceae bacterium]|jgi:YD repeat-containing protein